MLFTVWQGLGWDNVRSEMLILETGERIPVQPGGRTGRYATSGHLLYCRGYELMAVPFNLKRAEVTDTPIPLGVAVAAGEGA